MQRDLKIEQVPAANGITVLRLSGDLDAHTFDDFDSMLQDLFDDDRHKLILDMSGVGYLSSAGIGTLVSAAAKCSADGGNLVLVKVNDRCLEVLKLLGLHETLQFADDIPPALARF